ncbi:putative ATP-dependent Clp protease ATP-binding subunit ClpX [Glarea lozoyensis 74030]|uniref:Putative ATP-dependent Clp protease ATP-binding subunit ClpX n=1 Tax=Glarea lozoyensis (strain ATCC 74030 / MF5533) TaxID=1104152 RepID=H0ELJ3_GLAL7|nr:putative ATP-dependent Clp protease ATP-binding subunit ClpX [Glarea lozoyensis 74030]
MSRALVLTTSFKTIREIRRQEAEEREKKEQKLRRESREKADKSHPVENEFPGHPQTVDLNRKPEPEPEIGSKPLEDDKNTIIEKSNLLLLGPSGAGYIGSDIESSIERLLLAAAHSVPKCETGIIFFDEVDKLAKPAVVTHGRDVSGEGVQQGLLKMIEGTTVTINAKQDRNSKTESNSSRGGDRLERGTRESGAQPGKSEQYTIDTTNILFVFAGAFVGLEKIVAKRLSAGSSIGFGAPIRPPTKKPSPTDPPNLLQKVNTSDLQSYGLIPELLGRIPITVSLSPLSLDQLVSILRDPKNSLIKQYTALFATYNVSLRFTTAALHALASQALHSTSSLSSEAKNDDKSTPGMGVGARGLRTILESVLQETMFIAPGSDIRFCLIDEAFVKAHFAPGEKEREKIPQWWSRGARVAFEEVFEREEGEWDDRVNGKVIEEEEDRGGFEKLRVGGSSGITRQPYRSSSEAYIKLY